MKALDFPLAEVSSDGVYRSVLRRIIERDLTYQPEDWDRILAVIMLNPSTADASRDDATIRRLKAYAKSWGYGNLLVANLFAFRATSPLVMKAALDPIGPDCNLWIERAARAAVESGGVVIAAWGAHARGLRRVRDVVNGPLAGVPLCALALTDDGIPRHPLRLPSSLKPQPWALPA